jgi:hypothetical protein
MTFKLFVTDRDDFNEVGEGGRQDGDIWYRKDLHEIRACLEGTIVTVLRINDGVVFSAKLVESDQETSEKFPDNVQ